MTDNSCKSLFDLYLRAGEHLVTLGEKRQAADAFALGLYYATELANPQAQQFCRQRIVHCNSAHPACQTPPPPLVFAQLLMNFPAESAEATLAKTAPAPVKVAAPAFSNDSSQWRSMGVFVMEDGSVPGGKAVMAEPVKAPSVTVPLAKAAPNAFALAETQPVESHMESPGALNPFETSSWTPSDESSTKSIFDFELAESTVDPVAELPPAPVPKTPVAKATVDIFSKPVQPMPLPTPAMATEQSFDSHHIYDLGSGPMGVSPDSIRAVEDLLLSTPVRSSEPVVETGGTPLAGLLNFAAALAAMVGFASVGFFGYSLYPQLKQFDIQQFVETMTKGKDGQSRANPQSSTGEIIVQDNDQPIPPVIVSDQPNAPLAAPKWTGAEQPAVFVAPAVPARVPVLPPPPVPMK